METRYVPAGKVAFDNTRRGWQDRGPPRGGHNSNGRDRRNERDRSPVPRRNYAAPALRAPGPDDRGQARPAICHTCYEVGHYSSGFQLPVDSFLTIVHNYTALQPHQKAWVPRISFDNALAQVQRLAESVARQADNLSSPKN